MDIWPFSVLFFNLPYKLHGISHSFLIALIIALIISIVRIKFSDKLKLKRSFNFIFLSSLIGTFSHVILDIPLYKDMTPFWPSLINPFYGLISYSNIILFCIICFVLAGIIFGIKLIYKK